MKSNLLKEVQQLFDRGRNGDNIPVPSYLFVQRYGREIHEDMQEISTLFGLKEWFPFSCALTKNDEKLVTGLQMELERHSGVGKEYTGSILVELSGKEEDKELEELLDYVDSQKYRLRCVYAIKASENVKHVKGLLENYGFVRVVLGEEYDASEQIEIFMDTIEEFQYRLEKTAKECIVDFFNKQKWQEKDGVKIRIQNMAREIIYNKLIDENASEKVISKEEMENVINSRQWEKMTRRPMGFVMGGVEIE